MNPATKIFTVIFQLCLIYSNKKVLTIVAEMSELEIKEQ